MSKEKIIIIGAGDLGKQLFHYINTCSSTSVVTGFVDDIKQLGEEIFPGIKVEARTNGLNSLRFDKLLMGIGYNSLPIRQQLFERLSSLYSFATFIHPHSFIDKTAKLGQSIIVLPGCIIEQGVTIENNVFLYNSVTLAHDCVIRKGSFLAPSVTVAGFSIIGECCFAGAGSVISNNISICADAKLGAGSLVIKNITQPGWYAGNPCTKITKP